MEFNKKYFLATIILFLIEVSIATIFKGIPFVRAYLGDVLVVILIYTFIMSFFRVKNKTVLVLGIFIFASFIETLQYLGISDFLNLKNGSWQQIVVGNSFSWGDILCYAAGCMVILLYNNYLQSQKA